MVNYLRCIAQPMNKITFCLGFCVCLLGVANSYAQQPGTGLTAIAKPWQAEDFSLVDIEGETHRLADYRGKVVVLNFWATWCPPCRAEMPSMQRAWEKVKDKGVVLLGVDVGEDEDTVFEFTANYPLNFPLLLDIDSKVAKQWPVRGLPTTYVIDPFGLVVYQAVGGREWDSKALLDKVLQLRKLRE